MQKEPIAYRLGHDNISLLARRRTGNHVGLVDLLMATTSPGTYPVSLGRRPTLVDGVRTPTVAETVGSGFRASSEETYAR